MATLKGGSGKTANTFNISGILAETNRVLLIDVDPQCNLSSNCGVDVTDPNLKSVRDIFDNLPKSQPTASEIIFRSPINELPNLDIIPSSIMLFKTEMAMSNKTNREHILEFFINNNIDCISQYDYVIIDTNPSMSVININAFYVSDKIILSSDVSTNSINGAELFCTLWDERREELYKEDNIAALIICNYDRRTNLSKNLVDYTSGASFSQELVIKTVVPTTVKIKNSEIEHLPVNLLYPKDKIRTTYNTIVNELKDKGVL